MVFMNSLCKLAILLLCGFYIAFSFFLNNTTTSGSCLAKVTVDHTNKISFLMLELYAQYLLCLCKRDAFCMNHESQVCEVPASRFVVRYTVIIISSSILLIIPNM
jgi:hypothetical protein